MRRSLPLALVHGAERRPVLGDEGRPARSLQGHGPRPVLGGGGRRRRAAAHARAEGRELGGMRARRRRNRRARCALVARSLRGGGCRAGRASRLGG